MLLTLAGTVLALLQLLLMLIRLMFTMLWVVLMRLVILPMSIVGCGFRLLVVIYLRMVVDMNLGIVATTRMLLPLVSTCRMLLGMPCGRGPMEKYEERSNTIGSPDVVSVLCTALVEMRDRLMTTLTWPTLVMTLWLWLPRLRYPRLLIVVLVNLPAPP